MKFLLPAIAALGLCSCGTMSPVAQVKNLRAPKLGKLKEYNKNDLSRFSLRDLMPSKVGIATVDPKKLQALPSGQDRYLAYQDSKRRRYDTRPPADYRQPALPEKSEPVDFSVFDGILPAR